MSYLAPSDTNIVMDLGLPADVLKRLADSGVTAAVEFVRWPDIEPSCGVFDWSLPDAMVARCREAGIKAILMGPQEGPEWAPDSWFVRNASGYIYRRTDPSYSQVVWGHLSPWCDEAMGYQADVSRLFCAHYAAPDVICAGSLGRDAEALIPQHYTTMHDEHALKSYRNHTGDPNARPSLGTAPTQTWLYQSLSRYAVEQQRVYLAGHPSRTIFTALHPAYEIYVSHTGADYVHDLVEQLHPDQMAVIIWDYYSDGTERDWTRAAREYARVVRERDSAQIWAGSEWPEGLAANTPNAMRDGFSGLITAPIHPLRKSDQIGAWVYDAFLASSRLQKEVIRA
jgi:hypothetical protein